ncbi:hypothetical protein ONE63_008649 [Megalurothrips usitatus]|uniref:Uncharacterized protein n=1 Tax=Megalurothrips usitatus TaxID=439358 RepID=A0AAV7XLU8_9NEOP|nr:hypothetical protein ONE63_008649 [Megalurothrips usitatus]
MFLTYVNYFQTQEKLPSLVIVFRGNFVVREDKGNHLKLVAYFDPQLVLEHRRSDNSSSETKILGRLTRNDVEMVVFTLVLEDNECFAVSFKQCS